MSSNERTKKPLFGGAALALLAIVGLMADVAQLVDVRQEPLYIVLIVALCVVLVWSAAVLLGWHNRPRNGTFWLALGSLIAAGALLLIALGFGLAQITGAGSGNNLGGDKASSGSASSHTQEQPKNQVSSAPPNQTQRPDQPSSRFRLWLSQGADVDVTPPTVKKAGAAAGDTDLYLTYYGLLETTSRFYTLSEESGPQDCAAIIASGRPAEAYTSPQAGSQFCTLTSDEKVMWLEVIDSDLINFDSTQRYAEFEVRIMQG